jgi:rubredoxin
MWGVHKCIYDLRIASHTLEDLNMSIGPLEVLILLIIFLGILLISRRQTKRICPQCGFAIRSYTTECPECGLVFPKKEGLRS